MTENPYQAPSPLEPGGAVRTKRSAILRRYRLFILIGYLAPIAASAVLWRLSLTHESVIHDSGLMRVVRSVLYTEFIGVLCCLAAVPILIVRAAYLLAARRFDDSIFDACLAGAGFLAAWWALILNPITD